MNRWSARRQLAHLAAVGVLAGIAVVAGGRGAAAAPLEVGAATFEWGVSVEVQSQPPAGACNYLSAGVSDGTQAAYLAVEGNVAIVKDDTTPTWVTKCEGAATRAVNQRVVWTNGTGTVDPATGTVDLTFQGVLSFNFYGGLIPFTIQDLHVVVLPDGTGSITAARAFGYSSSQDDPLTKHPLEPVPDVVIADLSGVPSANTTGFAVVPDYAGVEYTPPEGSDSAPQNRVSPGWGSWPSPWVDFHLLTGLGSYWYSSGGGADSLKPPTALAISYSGEQVAIPTTTTTTTAPATTSSSSTLPDTTSSLPADPAPTTATTAAPVVPDPTPLPTPVPTPRPAPPVATTTTTTTTTTGPPLPGLQQVQQQTLAVRVPPATGPGEFTWTIEGDELVQLGTVVDRGTYLQTGGELAPVTVSDTRPGGPAWSLSAQVSDFSGGLDARHLGWVPRVIEPGGGTVAGPSVAPALAGGDGLSVPAILASAPDGHAPGTAVAGAEFDLRLPAGTDPGTYTAVLTITALS